MENSASSQLLDRLKNKCQNVVHHLVVTGLQRARGFSGQEADATSRLGRVNTNVDRVFVDTGGA
jgi:hypothetical protein